MRVSDWVDYLSLKRYLLSLDPAVFNDLVIGGGSVIIYSGDEGALIINASIYYKEVYLDYVPKYSRPVNKYGITIDQAIKIYYPDI